MRPAIALLFLLGAAVLEAGGDAIVRRGLHADHPTWRYGLILAGGAVLMAYGVTVNLPSWDFGRLLGVYVALFFLVAQLTNAVLFGVAPSLPIVVGGAFILTGGMIMTFWRYS
jgi:drug/metabolite transporter superfamily protein YnfA